MVCTTMLRLLPPLLWLWLLLLVVLLPLIGCGGANAEALQEAGGAARAALRPPVDVDGSRPSAGDDQRAGDPVLEAYGVSWPLVFIMRSLQRAVEDRVCIMSVWSPPSAATLHAVAVTATSSRECIQLCLVVSNAGYVQEFARLPNIRLAVCNGFIAHQAHSWLHRPAAPCVDRRAGAI